MPKPFSIITACYKNSRGIGFQNKLPWKHIKEDMTFFYNTTKGKKNILFQNAVIMGRKTWDSLSHKPLPYRHNIVITSKPTIHNNYITKSSLEEALYYTKKHPCIRDVFVIGGESIYKQAIEHPYCKHIYVTNIQQKETECDTFFPKIPVWFAKNSYSLQKSLVFEEYCNIQEKTSDEMQYIYLIQDILKNGEKVYTRNGSVLKTFGAQHIFDLQQGFPLLTTKKMFFKGIVEELLFFIQGQTNSKILEKKGVKIWKDNTTKEFLQYRNLPYKEGDMGPMYGYNWRHFGYPYNSSEEDYTNKGYDQLYHLLQSLKNDKHSRRHLLTTYDPSRVSESVLAPCHGIVSQFYISSYQGEEYLHCKMYQRSVDVALGYPFNIASYALFVHILCYITGYKPGKLIMTLGDTHIYESHVPMLQQQIERVPLQQPILDIQSVYKKHLSPIENIERLCLEDIVLRDYHSYPRISMKMVA